MRMRVVWMVLGLLASASVGWAQATLPVPTAPLTVCISQVLPPAANYQLVFDGGAPEAVTVTAADASKCKTSDTGSFTVAASRWTAGQHTLRVNAVNGGGVTAGPAFTVTIQSPKPGEPVITGVVAGVVIPPPTGATLATFGLSAGSATFGLALPQGVAPAAVKLGALTTQTDVKTRWADGSIRFAVVSAQVPSAGQYAVTAGTSASGALTPSWPSASVTFNISGASWVATLPAFNGAETWLVGPVVREARVMVAPRNGSTDHPLLQVIYDVRSYASGGHRVDVTVQNVKDVTAGNSVTYDVAVSVGGQSVFSRAGVTQSYLTRWRKTFTTGGLVDAAVTPDVEPFYASKALPRFHAQVTDYAYGPLTDPKFDILDFGDMSKGMGSPGGRPELGPYPEWVVRYLVHKKPAARAYMLRHADLSGSWSGHITKADGKSSIKLDEWPNYWLDGRAGTNPNGPNATRKADGFLAGLTEGLETAHLPNLTFVPYLLTGDRYYLDQQKLWSHFVLLWTWPGDGWRSKDGAKGVLYQNQIRGYGWGLLKIGETTAYLPDSDPDKAYFQARIDENLAFLDRRPVEDPGGPLAVPMTARMGPDGEGYASTSMWQVSYLAIAVDRLRQLGATGGGAFLRYASGFQVRLLTSAADGFPPIYGAPYYPKVGRWSNGAVSQWFSMAEIYAVNYKSGAEPPQPLTGYYGPETFILLEIAVAQGIPKAQEAMTFLSSQAGVMGDIYGRSGWAVASVGTR